MFPARSRQATEAESVAEQLSGNLAQTQLARLFEQLQITSIAARSPQAKGRIERLWGTFQDRLVSELRLAGATTLQEANVVLQAYLPRFNARFAVACASKELAWQALPSELSPEQCFCWQESRTVAPDNTISYKGKRLQLLPGEHRRSWVRVKVLVHETFTGQLSVWYSGTCLPSRLAQADPNALREASGEGKLFPCEEGAPTCFPSSLAYPSSPKGAFLTFLLNRKDDIFIGP